MNALHLLRAAAEPQTFDVREALEKLFLTLRRGNGYAIGDGKRTFVFESLNVNDMCTVWYVQDGRTGGQQLHRMHFQISETLRKRPAILVVGSRVKSAEKQEVPARVKSKKALVMWLCEAAQAANNLREFDPRGLKQVPVPSLPLWSSEVNGAVEPRHTPHMDELVREFFGKLRKVTVHMRRRTLEITEYPSYMFKARVRVLAGGGTDYTVIPFYSAHKTTEFGGVLVRPARADDQHPLSDQQRDTLHVTQARDVKDLVTQIAKAVLDLDSRHATAATEPQAGPRLEILWRELTQRGSFKLRVCNCLVKAELSHIDPILRFLPGPHYPRYNVHVTVGNKVHVLRAHYSVHDEYVQVSTSDGDGNNVDYIDSATSVQDLAKSIAVTCCKLAGVVC